MIGASSLALRLHPTVLPAPIDRSVDLFHPSPWNHAAAASIRPHFLPVGRDSLFSGCRLIPAQICG